MTAAVARPAPGPRSGRPHLAPVPDSEPPFDADENGAQDRPSTRRRRTPARPAGAALKRPAVIDGSAIPVGSAPTSVTCQAVPSWLSESDIGVERTASARMPAPGRAAQVLATALAEVLVGRRPVGQLRAHCSPQVYAGLVNRIPKGPRGLVHVMSVRVCRPADGIAEVSATVRSEHRVRALAFRLEGVNGRWRITALEIV